MGITRVLSIFFFIVAIGLAYLLVKNIKSKIDEDARIERQEDLVINKLKMIRDAEVAYLATNGKYTSSFDTLISFIDTGSIYITRDDKVYQNKKFIKSKYHPNNTKHIKNHMCPCSLPGCC